MSSRSTGTELVEQILGACFTEGLPKRLEAMIDLELSAQHLADFKLNPVLCSEGGKAHIAYANTGEDTRWRAKLRRQWPAKGLDTFLSMAPPQARRMVDTDGSNRAMVYIDDLQDVPHSLPVSSPLICATLDLPKRSLSLMSRHRSPPLAELQEHGPQWAGRLRAFLDRGVAELEGGIWGIRWRPQGKTPGEICGLLWVSESRWVGNTKQSSALARAWELPRWSEISDICRSAGALCYPDAVELQEHGYRVTVGFEFEPD